MTDVVLRGTPEQLLALANLMRESNNPIALKTIAEEIDYCQDPGPNAEPGGIIDLDEHEL